MSEGVFRVAEDGLSRERWDFSKSYRFGGDILLTLTRYSVERRRARKGRFAGAGPADRWLSFDERRYTSGLPRPTAIPDDIMREAISKLTFRFFIGWAIAEHEVASPSPLSQTLQRKNNHGE